jgi:DNA-binding NarL/FixJ family response regulator
VLTEVAVLRGDPKAAVARVRATVEALTDESGARPDVTVRLAALALSAVADAAVELRSAGGESHQWRETADELVTLAREVARRDEDDPPQGPEGLAWLARAEAEWTRAVSGPDATAWEKAVAAFDYGDVYERLRCQVRYAEALLGADQRQEAAEQARAARAVAERLGAAPLLERLDALIRRGRLAAAPAHGERSSPLTAREQDVLRLLARGRSNRQIGEELFITGKTASVHVSNILAKLGAASRTEAVAIAYRQGLVAPEHQASG